ncbi:uvrd / recb / pcra DNA helicase family member [Anaeramoeba ignava]|uniref:DNA 3'-5' helicase n=1 Tax=Anaeramoeba ignava TaxID=1746090 RepID=A0A9Q0L988_ANAIG|nr:uvrd / recb / pcra DNA helicase family member [Anaeramoeba ignava]
MQEKPKLNQEQQLAVDSDINKPLLIVAGCGSGKTTVLISRIARMISLGIPTESIIAITFTQKAAEELKQRVSSFIHSISISQLKTYTFHAFGLSILRAEGSSLKLLGYRPIFKIISSFEQFKIIENCLKKYYYYKHIFIQKNQLLEDKNQISKFSFSDDFLEEDYDIDVDVDSNSDNFNYNDNFSQSSLSDENIPKEEVIVYNPDQKELYRSKKNEHFQQLLNLDKIKIQEKKSILQNENENENQNENKNQDENNQNMFSLDDDVDYYELLDIKNMKKKEKIKWQKIQEETKKIQKFILLSYSNFRKPSQFSGKKKILFKMYQNFIKLNDIIDFNDMIHLAIKLLKKFPEVLEKYKTKYKYFLVDEYQDTNLAQFQLVNLFVKESGRLTVVGDDDQCLPINTLVQTQNEQLKKIQNIQIGDYVKTSLGKSQLGFSKVSYCSKKFIKNSSLCSIKTKSGIEIKCTISHHLPITWIKNKKEQKTPKNHFICLIKNKNNYNYNWNFQIIQNLGNCNSQTFPLLIVNSRKKAEKIVQFLEMNIFDKIDYQLILEKIGKIWEEGYLISEKNLEKKIQIISLYEENSHLIQFKEENERKTLHFKSLEKARRVAKELSKMNNKEIIEKWKLVDSNENFQMIPACNVIPGSYLVVNNKLEKVVEVEFEDYQGEVYDLEVESTHNFILGNGAIIGNCIYAFRGANLDCFQVLKNQFSSTIQEVKLVENYRSTKTIVSILNYLIRNNKNRIKKTLRTSNTLGTKTSLFKCSTEIDEAIFCASKIKRLVREKKANFSEIAVLYRNRHIAETFKKIFHKQKIPFRVFGEQDSLDNLKEFRFFVTYLFFVDNPSENNSFKTVFKKYFKRLFIHEKSEEDQKQLKKKIQQMIQSITKYSQVKKTSLFDSSADIVMYLQRKNSKNIQEQKKGIELHLLDQLKKLFQLNINSLIQFVEIIHHCRKLISENRINDLYSLIAHQILNDAEFTYQDEMSRIAMENLQELNLSEMEPAQLFQFIKFKNIQFMEQNSDSEQKSHLEIFHKFVEQFILDPATFLDSCTGIVTLSTVHQSKGLEWPVVFLVRLNEKEFPVYKIDQEKGQEITEETIEKLEEEERRLFYVALSRAKNYLFISYIQNSLKPSSLLNSLPEHLINVQDWELEKKSIEVQNEKESQKKCLRSKTQPSLLNYFSKKPKSHENSNENSNEKKRKNEEEVDSSLIYNPIIQFQANENENENEIENEFKIENENEFKIENEFKNQNENHSTKIQKAISFDQSSIKQRRKNKTSLRDSIQKVQSKFHFDYSFENEPIPKKQKEKQKKSKLKKSQSNEKVEITCFKKASDIFQNENLNQNLNQTSILQFMSKEKKIL